MKNVKFKNYFSQKYKKFNTNKEDTSLNNAVDSVLQHVFEMFRKC